MKRKIFCLVNLIFATLITALTLCGIVFGWILRSGEDAPTFGASSTQGYYESGSGTEIDPYIISAPIHLYNLAWLQNTGVYDDTVTHFRLKNNIPASTMSRYVLPPIGNVDHPFNGVFNGNSKTISGLRVSTNKNILTVPSSADLTSHKFSNYVGMFGKTGEDSEIYGFILDDPIVEVAKDGDIITPTETLYSTATEDGISGSTSPAVGIAVGQANGKVHTIGVNGGKLFVRKSGYTTFNSILGDVASNNFQLSGKPSGGAGNNGSTGYFIPDVLYNNLSSPTINTAAFSNGSLKSGAWLMSSNGYKTVGGERTEVKDSSNYLGLGCFSVINRSGGTTEFRSSGTDPISSYYVAQYAESVNVHSASGSMPKNVPGYKISDSTTSSTIRETGITGNILSSFSHSFYFKNSPQLATASSYTPYSENPSDSLAPLTGNSNTIYTDTIMFYVSDPGNLKVTIVASSNDTSENRYIGIAKVAGYNGSDNFYFLNEYANINESGSAKSNYNQVIVLPPHTSNEPEKIIKAELDLTSAGLGAGVYAVSSTKSSVYYYYLAVEGVAGGNAGSPNYSETSDVSAVDFVYSGVRIGDDNNFYNSDGTTPYTETGTAVTFGSYSDILILAYIRGTNGISNISGNNYTISVTVYPSSETNNVSESISGMYKTSGNANWYLTRDGTYG